MNWMELLFNFSRLLAGTTVVLLVFANSHPTRALQGQDRQKSSLSPAWSEGLSGAGEKLAGVNHRAQSAEEAAAARAEAEILRSEAVRLGQTVRARDMKLRQTHGED